MSGEYTLADNRKARPAFALLAEEVNVAKVTGVPEAQIRSLAHALKRTP
ncbi:MAG: hypothetical protein HRT36_04335 [Alphaproteobacteria bacterium]|nr:hypothetical protein [Alphaproteobacteria bacterium]